LWRQDGSRVLDRLHRLGRRWQSRDATLHLADALEPVQIPVPVVRFGLRLERHPVKLFIGKFSLEYAFYLSSHLGVGCCTLEGVRV
jgi:hypothetical protein